MWGFSFLWDGEHKQAMHTVFSCSLALLETFSFVNEQGGIIWCDDLLAEPRVQSWDWQLQLLNNKHGYTWSLILKRAASLFFPAYGISAGLLFVAVPSNQHFCKVRHSIVWVARKKILVLCAQSQHVHLHYLFLQVCKERPSASQVIS